MTNPNGLALHGHEIDPHHADVARSTIARAELDGLVDVRVGPALDTLAALDGPFDLNFVDADKPSNADYFREALRLSRPGAMIIADNVVRGGAVVDATSTDPAVLGTRRLAEAIAAEPRVDATSDPDGGRQELRRFRAGRGAIACTVTAVASGR